MEQAAPQHTGNNETPNQPLQRKRAAGLVVVSGRFCTRTMKPLLFLALALLFSASVTAGEEQPKTFNSLSDATKLLDRALASRDREMLSNAFPPSAKTYFSEHPEVFRMLVDERGRTGSLEKLYDGRTFPTTGKPSN